MAALPMPAPRMEAEEPPGDRETRRSRRWRPGLTAWMWWIPVVVGLSLPVIGFTRHPQWQRVHIVPFSDPEDKLRDQVVNIAMFVPFGYLYARPRRLPRALIGALAWAVVVSAGAEATQVFSTARDPSGTDVSMALVGTAIGALLSVLSGTLTFTASR